MIFPFKSKRVRELEAEVRSLQATCEAVTARYDDCRNSVAHSENRHMETMSKLHASEATCAATKGRLDKALAEAEANRALSMDLARTADSWKEKTEVKTLTIQEVRRGLTAMLGYISGEDIPVSAGTQTDANEGVRQLVEDMTEQMELDTDMDASCQCAHGCAPCSGCVHGDVHRKRLVHRAQNFLAAIK